MEEQTNGSRKNIVKKVGIGAGIVLALYLLWSVLSVFISPNRHIQQIYLVPENAAFIIQSSGPVDDWQTFSKSEPWQTLKKAKTFEDITRQVETLDSVIHENKTLLSLIGKRDLLISIHKTKTADWDALFILDMQKISKLDLLKDQIEVVLRMTDFTVTQRTYNRVNIIEMRDPKTRDILYTAFIDNHLVASYTSGLLEAAIDTRDTPKIGLDASFIEAEKRVAGKGLYRIFVNYAALPDFMSLYFDKQNEFISLFVHSMEYAGLWFGMDQEKIEMKGHTFLREDADPYMTALLNSGNRKMKAHEIMSARTAFYTHIGLENVPAFTKELETVLSATDTILYRSYKESKAKIERMSGISLDEHFLSWMSGEFAIAQLEPGLLGQEPELILAVGAKDMPEARRQMEYIEKRVKSRIPIRIKTVNYKGFDVNYIEMKGFFRLFFGGLFDKFEKPYYTYIDDYVVFSNQASSLLSFIEDYEQKNLLKDNPDFKKAYSPFSTNSTLFLYMNMHKFYPQLQGMLNTATWNNVRSNKEIICSFPHWTTQIVGDHRSATLLYVMDYAPYIPEEFRVMDADEFDDGMDAEASSEKELMSELERFYIEKFQGNVLREFYPDGTLRNESEVKEGKRHGRYREYYENGRLKVRGKFVNNRPKGTWKFYTAEGKFERKEKF